jgi:hypothetical protein
MNARVWQLLVWYGVSLEIWSLTWHAIEEWMHKVRSKRREAWVLRIRHGIMRWSCLSSIHDSDSAGKRTGKISEFRRILRVSRIASASRFPRAHSCLLREFSKVAWLCAIFTGIHRGCVNPPDFCAISSSDYCKVLHYCSAYYTNFLTRFYCHIIVSGKMSQHQYGISIASPPILN